MSAPPALEQIVVAGPGRLGASLCLSLEAAGIAPDALLGPPGPAQQGGLPCVPSLTMPLDQWVPKSGPGLLILAIPDDELSRTAVFLADHTRFGPGWIVLHTAGAVGYEILSPLRQAGLAIGAWHPLQTFSSARAGLFEGIPLALEGDPCAVSAGESLARAVGARPFRLPSGERPLYHCLASIACGHVAALLLRCREALEIFPPEAREPIWLGLLALSGQTVANLRDRDSAQALTGPSARGDRGTVALHEAALEAHFPDWLPLYRMLDQEVARLAGTVPQVPEGGSSDSRGEGPAGLG